MSKRIKGKPISKGQIERTIVQESGETVALGYDVWPRWAQDARDPNVDHILFCSIGGPQKVYKKGESYSFGNAIGRLTVIRYDAKDAIKGFPHNKDVYVFVCADDDSIIQYGPFSKGEPDHWMEFVSDEYKDWPFVEGKKSDKKS